MQHEFDLHAYFDRIGYNGVASATLTTLRELHRLHPQAIPFENLDPLLRWPVQLDLRSVQTKLLSQHRGGYCYEHNLLFKHVLEQIGFHVRGLAARVLWSSGEDVVRPRLHMLLQVDLDDEPWIADVGFGGLTLTAPLRLLEDTAQPTPHEPARLARSGTDYSLQAEIRGEWRTLYRFDLQEQFFPDYQMASWYLSNHPESPFLQRLMAARAEPERRYALADNELAVHETSGGTTRRTLTSGPELRAALQDTFRIALPESAALDEVLARIARGQPPA